MRLYDLLRLHVSAAALVACCFGALLAFPSSVNAQFRHAQASSGWTVDWGGGQMGPSAQWSPSATTNVGGGASWGVSNGAVVGSGTGRIPNGSSVVDVSAKVVPTNGNIAAALGRFARKALPVVGTAIALRDLISELNYRTTDGSVWEKRDTSVCTVAPCYNYQASLSGATGAWSTTPDGACSSAASVYNTKGTPYTAENPRAISGLCYGDFYNRSDGKFFTTVSGSITSAQVAPSPEAWTVSSMQDFLDQIALKSGWPTSSAISRAVPEALNAGESIPGPVTVTGPATSPGPTTSTTDSTGKVTQQNTTYNYTYNGNSITYNTTVVTTVNGSTTETTTKTPDKPTDPCDGKQTVGCADMDTPSDLVPKTTKNVSYQAEDLGLGAGACPAPFSFSTRLGVYALDLSPYCSALVSYVRPVVLLVAMFIAYLIVTGTRTMGDD